MSTWLEQKLAQNGFTLEDLASQTGLSLNELKALSQTEKGTSLQWDEVLSVLNDYPSIQYPSDNILTDLNQDLSEYPDGKAQIYYGALDGSLVFTGYLCLDSGAYHGANIPTDYLSSLVCDLSQAAELFRRQNAASN